MALNFGQILDAVTTDGIDQSRRTDAHEWVRLRHAALWNWNNWTFKFEQNSLTFTNGQQILNTSDYPTDIHSILALYDQYGQPLRGYRDVRQFFDNWNTLATPTSSVAPEGYTLIAGQLYVGPAGNGSTGLIVYEKEKPSLVNDSDATGLPDGFDLALVHGGKAEGMLMTNNPLAQTHEQAYMSIIAEMENGWLDQTLETGEQSGAYRPGSGYLPW